MLLKEIFEKELRIPRSEWIKDRELVRQIQQRLKDAGLLDSSKITGVFDPESEKALKRFAELSYLDTPNHWIIGRSLAKALIEIPISPQYPFQLQVPYFSQRDNLKEPLRTCNTSSSAMLLKYLKPDAITNDDDYYKRFVEGRFDTTDHTGHTRALRSLGIESEWRTDLDYKDIDEQLRRKIPTTIGILHRGSLSAPTGGHVIIVIGKKSESEYICHDSFGEGFGAQYERNHNGQSVVYTKESLNYRWLANARPGTGWGRIVFSK